MPSWEGRKGAQDAPRVSGWTNFHNLWSCRHIYLVSTAWANSSKVCVLECGLTFQAVWCHTQNKNHISGFSGKLTIWQYLICICVCQQVWSSEASWALSWLFCLRAAHSSCLFCLPGDKISILGKRNLFCLPFLRSCLLWILSEGRSQRRRMLICNI